MNVSIVFWMGMMLGAEITALVFIIVILWVRRGRGGRQEKPVGNSQYETKLGAIPHLFQDPTDRYLAYWILSNIHIYKTSFPLYPAQYYWRLAATEKRLGMPLRLLNWRTVFRKLEQENLI